MRIGDINQGNYMQFMKMFSGLGGKEMKLPIAKLQSSFDGVQDSSVNPFEDQERNITSKNWKQIVPVSDEVKDKLLSIVRSDFINKNGMSGENYDDPNGYNVTVKNYLNSIPSSERSSASWTLSNIFTNEARRLATIVKAHNPGWDYGQPFDTSILNEPPASSILNVKV